jgi:hypothetical protein
MPLRLPDGQWERKPGELSAPNARQSQLPQDSFGDHAVRHESRLPHGRIGSDARFRVVRIAWGELCSPTRSGRAFLSRSCGRMTSTDKKKITQFVVALPGPHNETERATPCSVPRRPPRAVKAATRRSSGGLRPAWTAECCAAVSAHPFFLSEKWEFFSLSLERNTLSIILFSALGN